MKISIPAEIKTKDESKVCDIIIDTDTVINIISETATQAIVSNAIAKLQKQNLE